MRKGSHSPRRTCIGCAEPDEQRSMVRLAIANGNIVIDFERRVPGRGGYLHPRTQCLERFVASRAKEFRSLRRRIDRAERARIVNALSSRLAGIRLVD